MYRKTIMLTGKLGKADETQNDGWMFSDCILANLS